MPKWRDRTAGVAKNDKPHHAARRLVRQLRTELRVKPWWAPDVPTAPAILAAAQQVAERIVVDAPDNPQGTMLLGATRDGKFFAISPQLQVVGEDGRKFLDTYREAFRALAVACYAVVSLAYRA
jgi:hypothetical protein